MRCRFIALFSFAALEFAAVPLAAQEELHCASWAATLASGSLDETRAQEIAYTRIGLCPASIRGEALSQALERRKYVTSFNDLSTEVFALASRDQPVFDALIRMSHDRTATATARVLAIATLLAMVDTHEGARLDRFMQYREGEACPAGGSPVDVSGIGGPLAPDSTRRVIEVLRSLERSRSTDPAVRSAANCALNVLRLRDLGNVAEIAPFSASDLTFRYRCGSFFIVTNRSPFSYLATVRAPGGEHPRALTIQGTRGRRASETTMFEGVKSGSVELVVDDVTYTASSSNRSCARR